MMVQNRNFHAILKWLQVYIANVSFERRNLNLRMWWHNWTIWRNETVNI